MPLVSARTGWHSLRRWRSIACALGPTAQAHPDSLACHLQGMGVHPRAQRRGVQAVVAAGRGGLLPGRSADE